MCLASIPPGAESATVTLSSTPSDRKSSASQGTVHQDTLGTSVSAKFGIATRLTFLDDSVGFRLRCGAEDIRVDATAFESVAAWATVEERQHGSLWSDHVVVTLARGDMRKGADPFRCAVAGHRCAG